MDSQAATIRHQEPWTAPNRRFDNAAVAANEIDLSSAIELPGGCLLFTYSNRGVIHQDGTLRLSPGRIKLVIGYMCAHLADPIKIDELAAVSCMSRFHFVRAFHATVGITPYQYLIRLRMERARILLADTALPIGEVACQVGYIDQSHFSAQFRRQFNCTPKAYRKRV